MRRKEVLWVVNGLFYLVMLVLALFAKKLYTASLPCVRVGYLERMSFLLDGESVYVTALPEALYGKTLYSVEKEEKNGEERFVVRELQAEISGEKQNGYYPVLRGISAFVMLVVEGMEELEEGREVFVENEEEIKSWN